MAHWPGRKESKLRFVVTSHNNHFFIFAGSFSALTYFLLQISREISGASRIEEFVLNRDFVLKLTRVRLCRFTCFVFYCSFSEFACISESVAYVKASVKNFIIFCYFLKVFFVIFFSVKVASNYAQKKMVSVNIQ